MATYWENSCSFGLRYVSWYKYLIVSLVFSHLGFWSGNLLLIAPFPDLCLLVPFYDDVIRHRNPYLTNGFAHHYHLGEPTFILRGIRRDFEILFKFMMKFLKANKIAQDGTPRTVASHLWLYCLPLSHKKDARLI